jgi:hypothetical protein
MILGCCALAFACILAWMEWGGRAPGGWLSDSDLHGLAKDVGIAMAISAGIGVGAIVLAVRVARVRSSSNAGPSQKKLL